MTFDVSITIAPKYRNKGLATSVLAEACSYMAEYTINAEIKHGNIASRKAFEGCGFEEIGRSSGYLNYRREPVR
jgi:RimJ/RimL family protein N-acetyltransferase